MKILKNSVRLPLRYSLFILTLVTMMSSVAFAQGPGHGGGRGGSTPEERAKRQTEMMKEGLNLTAAQEPKVSAINLKYAKKMEDVRKTADTAAMRKSAQTLNKQKEAELKAILTAEQFKLYLKQVEEMKARRREMQR